MAAAFRAGIRTDTRGENGTEGHCPVTFCRRRGATNVMVLHKSARPRESESVEPACPTCHVSSFVQREQAIVDGKAVAFWTCSSCLRKGPVFTNAATLLQKQNEEGGLIARMVIGDGGIALYDEGFYNIGVVPTVNDIAVGDKDPFGNPLSFSRQYLLKLQGQDVPDPFHVDPCTFEALKCETPEPDARVAVDGAFKVPTLRNVELTGPFFHTGGYATLESVVEFYDRGGNRRKTNSGDTSGFAGESSNLDPDIEPLDLSDREEEAIVAFLKALTDERVRWEMAPFDHPSLKITNGHAGNELHTIMNQDETAKDLFLQLPAVGRAGRKVLGLGPIEPFKPAP